MDWIDGVDIGRGLMPRRWKRHVALVFLAALVLFPNPAQRALFWYAQEHAERITRVVMGTVVPEPVTPVPAKVPAAPKR